MLYKGVDYYKYNAEDVEMYCGARDPGANDIFTRSKQVYDRPEVGEGGSSISDSAGTDCVGGRNSGRRDVSSVHIVVPSPDLRYPTSVTVNSSATQASNKSTGFSPQHVYRYEQATLGVIY